MNKILIAFIIFSIGGISCSTTKMGSKKIEPNMTEELIDKVVISNLTMQEHVSGVEGKKNIVEFLFSANSVAPSVVLDSLYFLDYACKIFAKNEAEGLYKATAKKNENTARTKEVKSVTITVTGSKKVIVVPETQMKVLEPLYMP
ncbi:MAG: hypothetical protein ACPGRC_02535 [Salibacteraceae bacterium]